MILTTVQLTGITNPLLNLCGLYLVQSPKSRIDGIIDLSPRHTYVTDFAENLPNYGYVLLSERGIRTHDLLIQSREAKALGDLAPARSIYISIHHFSLKTV